MRIPEVRNELKALAEEIRRAGFLEWSGKMFALERELYRRPAWRSSRIVSPPITEETRVLVRTIKRGRPDLTYQELSRIVGINTGRISEILRGFRT